MPWIAQWQIEVAFEKALPNPCPVPIGFTAVWKDWDQRSNSVTFPGPKGWWATFITTTAFCANKLPWQPSERPSALLSCQPWILMKTYYLCCFIQCVCVHVCACVWIEAKLVSQAGTIPFSSCWIVTSVREVFLFPKKKKKKALLTITGWTESAPDAGAFSDYWHVTRL